MTIRSVPTWLIFAFLFLCFTFVGFVHGVAYERRQCVKHFGRGVNHPEAPYLSVGDVLARDGYNVDYLQLVLCGK